MNKIIVNFLKSMRLDYDLQSYNEFFVTNKEIYLERFHNEDIRGTYDCVNEKGDSNLWKRGEYMIDDLSNWIIPRIMVMGLLPVTYLDDFIEGIKLGILNKKHEYQPVVDAVNDIKKNLH